MQRCSIFMLVLLALPSPAYAYLDPGTGSIILQGLVASLAAVAVFWYNVKAAVINYFSRKKPAEKKQEDV